MVKIGIIGLGRISGGHINGIKQAGTAQITAICDIDEQKLQTVGDSLGIPEAYRFVDYNDLIACPEVEAVEICTPNHLHMPMAIAAVKAGKHIEVEKPLSTTYANGVDELLAAIKEQQVVNMVCFSYRFKSAVRYAKHLIEQGKLGKIVNVNVEYLQSGVFIPGRRLEWRFVKEYAGSGTLGDLGVHLIDMTRFLLGEFESVCAMSTTVVKQRRLLDSEEMATVNVDDMTSFIARLEGDVIANFLVTKCAIGESNTIKYEIYGTDGVLKFDLNHEDEIMVCLGDVDKETGSLHTVRVPEQYRYTQESCFINAIKGENPPYFPPVAEGGVCQKILDALVQSAEENRIVKVER